jgi:hypothetical protein
MVEKHHAIVDGYGGQAPIRSAAAHGDLEVLKYLVEKGANVETHERYLTSLTKSEPLKKYVNRIFKLNDISKGENNG